MEENILEVLTRLAFQLALILVVAKVVGEVFQRYLHQPSVLGELVGGMAIGPYALGSKIVIPKVGVLFGQALTETGHAVSTIPVSTELYAIAQIGAVILLFLAGLETDLNQFLRYGGKAATVAVGGVIAPFVLGALATVGFGLARGWMDPPALFMGAIMTATSVGITARVLSEIKKLDSPEGVTILGAAVVDDVLGILVLAIVVSISQTGAVSIGEIGAIGGRAIGFWLALTAIAIILAGPISRGLRYFRNDGAAVGVALGIAFFCAALAEMFGLAMIIGAYSIGLGMSRTDIARQLEEKVAQVAHVLVPVFFVVMGMLVDFEAMGGALGFGLVITGLAIVSKIFGCGLPALALGFNSRGAFRIGFGMLPRGEVALIIAGVGLTSGVIHLDIFGVSILMTVVTTVLSPIFLVPAFRKGGSGRRLSEAA